MSPPNFYIRLRDYYLKVAEVLRGDAEAAAIFPNTSDIGTSRERVYADFLKQHAPSKCNVFLGGFLFHADGNESKQFDIIVTTDTTPRFNFHNRDGGGKSFSPVEGTLAVASIKSNLDKAQLEDALAGIASIPPSEPLRKRVIPSYRINNYEDWPYKIIYGSNGLRLDTIIKHLSDYYTANPEVPISRRPNLIHVAGKYVILRLVPGMNLGDRVSGEEISVEVGTFVTFPEMPDLRAICWVLESIQSIASASTHIAYSYTSLTNKISNLDQFNGL